MSQISIPNSTSVSPLGSNEISLRDADALLKASAFDKPVRPSSPMVLAALQAVVCRPPLLRLVSANRQRSRKPDAIIQEAIGTYDGEEMAFDIASFLIRHGEALSNLDDTEALEGLAVVGDVARMYEHLFVMQSGQGGDIDAA